MLVILYSIYLHIPMEIPIVVLLAWISSIKQNRLDSSYHLILYLMNLHLLPSILYLPLTMELIYNNHDLDYYQKLRYQSKQNLQIHNCEHKYNNDIY